MTDDVVPRWRYMPSRSALETMILDIDSAVECSPNPIVTSPSFMARLTFPGLAARHYRLRLSAVCYPANQTNLNNKYEIEYEAQWMLLAEFFERHGMGYDAERERREQVLRWEQNGQVFPLLELPAEIRELIYVYALGPVIVPQMNKMNADVEVQDAVDSTLGSMPTSDVWRPVLGNGHHHAKGYGAPRRALHFRKPDDPDIPPPNTNLLLAGHAPTKRFCDLAHLGDFTRTISDNLPYHNVLRSIQFELNMRDYTWLFIEHELLRGVPPQRPGGLTHTSEQPHCTPLLDLFPSSAEIEAIDFRIMSPINPDNRYLWDILPSCACWKAFTDNLLSIAAPQIGFMSRSLGVKRVTLSGCVKDSVKKKWEAILEGERVDVSRYERKSDTALRIHVACDCKRKCRSWDSRLRAIRKGRLEGAYFECED
ncbi:hypothetical protein BDV95DRAFT_666183 [Massariosphaeria phaeospora]|uniref:Uncharacterized protein n=1 Tax=Massariosphaeria phaeospora TaxID=100035 RepID=A0A7C8I9U9_9PLEO|nr:hypothetical protein BDV95DRAFT_666183 [Massariosphaeria phaeospora]